MKDTDKREELFKLLKANIDTNRESKIGISMRIYFSTYYLWAAEHFWKLAGEIETSHQGRPQFNLQHRVYIMNSILSATAFLEAAINEFYEIVLDDPKVY